jgi:DNA-binding SARP family transcriptional activator
MEARNTELAKLTRPRASRAIARLRLFSRIDQELGERPAVYVVGPPGAGKTTLVATWMEARNAGGIWYQMDADDGDPASFFYHIGRAAEQLEGHGRPSLPLLRPEYLTDLARFARRFFRELFGRLPRARLVLDNYQEVPPTSAVHSLVALAIEQAPRGAGVIVISRNEPPQGYARLQVNENIGLIYWSELQLTLEECEQIAHKRARSAVGNVEQLHAQSNGWAAGFTLLLESLQRSTAPAEPTDIHSLRTIFNYFATQLYDRASLQQQRVLLALSYLPYIPETVASSVVGKDGVPLLEDLHARRLFTERRRAREAIYQFHGLLAAFLSDRAERDLSSAEQDTSRLRAARALEECGYPGEAWELYLAAGRPEDAQRIVVVEAPRFIAQGRWKTVIDAIERLPPQLLASSPDLNLWLGCASMALDPVRARDVLETSYALATSAGDKMCQVQAASAVIQTYILQYTRFKPLDHWTAVLHDLLQSGVTFASQDVELRVQSALLIALAYRQPAHPAIADCVERVIALVQSEADINLRAIGIAYVFGYGATTGPIALSRRALPILQTLLAHPNVTPLNRAWSNFVIAWFHCVSGNFDQSEEAARAIHRIETDDGLPHARKFHLIISAWRELFKRAPDAAWPWVQQLASIQNAGRPYDTATYHVTVAWHHVLSGRPDSAVEHYAQGQGLFDEVGSVMHQVIYRFYAAFALTGCRRYAEAYQVVREAREVAGSGLTAWQACALSAAEASVALDEGDEARARRALIERFRVGRVQGEEAGVVNVLGRFMPRLCAFALENGIEVEHVRRLIQRHGWDPPDAEVVDWPASVKIRTLGGLVVVIAGIPLSHGRKPPRKPLAVLKSLIAMGGLEVPQQRLMDALWPDEDGDSAYRAYKMALHRLRTLLGDGCVLTQGSTVSLNPRRCQVDVWELDPLLSSVMTRLRVERSDAGARLSDALRMAEEIAAIYQGPFLPADTDAAWAMPMREKLRFRYIELVTALGEHLESVERWTDAIEWYRRGLQADELAEPFYQGLMRCYQKSNKRTEALNVYRLMRQTFSSAHDIEPSEHSERIYRSLQLADAQTDDEHARAGGRASNP